MDPAAAKRTDGGRRFAGRDAAEVELLEQERAAVEDQERFAEVRREVDAFAAEQGLSPSDAERDGPAGMVASRSHGLSGATGTGEPLRYPEARA